MNKILLIDFPRQRQMEFAELIANFMPELNITLLDPRSGIPAKDYPWSDYDVILMGYDLGKPDTSGFDWLQILRKYPSMLSPENIELTNGLMPQEESTMETRAVYKASMENTLDISGEDLAASNPSIKTGYPVIPGYEIVSFIAQGGMAEVLLAKNEEDKAVVLKILHMQEGEQFQEGLKRFIKEYNLISNIDHPHIIKIYERAFAADFAYIAMEYFPAGDLNKRIKEGINDDKALDYLHQMTMGLQAAHDLNIVHRDLKPGNILFREDDTLTITDFGVAKTISGEPDITVDNTVIGTPYYLSPEQGAGMKTDHRSDLYSLGVIFYQMLTGERPYTATTIAQLLKAHLNEPIPQLTGNLKKYQPLLDGLLAKDPDERFQNTKDLLLGIEWIN
ncbi:MAG: serine/threonine-protein kinase [Gammaproteobacteria bacterium]